MMTGGYHGCESSNRDRSWILPLHGPLVISVAVETILRHTVSIILCSPAYLWSGVSNLIRMFCLVRSLIPTVTKSCHLIWKYIWHEYVLTFCSAIQHRKTYMFHYCSIDAMYNHTEIYIYIYTCQYRCHIDAICLSHWKCWDSWGHWRRHGPGALCSLANRWP